jgi:predicted anti-sigma-YlaC factor YlaD
MLFSWTNYFRITAGEKTLFGLGKILGLIRNTDMDCVQVRKLSSDYLEGDLPPSRLEKIRAHLSGCPPCRSFVDSLASVVSMLTNSQKAESPPHLKQSIWDRIEEEGQGPTRGHRLES